MNNNKNFTIAIVLFVLGAISLSYGIYKLTKASNFITPVTEFDSGIPDAAIYTHDAGADSAVSN